MNRSVMLFVLLLAGVSGAAFGLKPKTSEASAAVIEKDQRLAEQGPVVPSDAIEAATEQWWKDYEDVRSVYPNTGVQRDGVTYVWTGPTPIEIPMIKLGVLDGEEVMAPEPVAYALYRSSSYWVEIYPLESNLSAPGPTTCNAKLVKGPAPSLGMRFVCEQQCGGTISCLASQTSPQQMGYCSCGGGNPPTTYCYGTFTTTDGGLSWNIACSATACISPPPPADPVTCQIHTQTDQGFEYHWCKCK